jgi:phenylalanyl-tRNA synthetase beta chain
MRVPLRWLAEWIDFTASPEELAERLTAAGLEVDAILRIGPDLSGLRVGLVAAREKHPNADRLSLCRVDLGTGELLEIVCGAPNVAAGQKVAVALAGSPLPDGRVLERSKIRGVVSNGMICSARELGLGEEAGGILVLDPGAPVGAPLHEVIAGGDTVLDLAIPPNRGDCASMLGVAREVRALFGGEIRLPPITPGAAAVAAPALRVEIDDRDGCFRYVGRIIEGIRVGPSPDWVRARLEAAGQRAINNIVDATNLVLLELGQPLHAFDLDRVRGGVVRVRSGVSGERLQTLDGVERTLAPEDLVIADAEGALALAGVMGGATSQVQAGTTRILLESAHFAPERIRRTARRLGLASEASYRFERGVDRVGIERAADRAVRLLEEIAGGSAAGTTQIARGAAAPATEEIPLDPGRVNRLLGTSLATAEIVDLLARVEVRAQRPEQGTLRCTIPSHRNDLHRYQDLIEEVVRIYGCDRVPDTLPQVQLAPVALPPLRVLADGVRDAFTAAGLHEAITLSFGARSDLDAISLSPSDPRRAVVTIANPISEGQGCLRSTLLPGLLRAARENIAHRVDRVRLFEVSRVFYDRGQSALPDEPLRVTAVVVRGERTSLWDAREPAPLFFEAKGLAERVLLDLGRAPEFRAGSGEPFLHPGAASEIGVAGQVVGHVGELHPEVARRFALELPCAVIDLDLQTLAGIAAVEGQYREISQQPPVRRDLAVLVERSVAAGEVLEAIRKSAGRDLVSLDLFDRYEGTGVPDGKISQAFRLVFQRLERAFTDAEIAKTMERVVGMLSHRFGGELRSTPAQGGGA